jgi:hypothetical protein
MKAMACGAFLAMLPATGLAADPERDDQGREIQYRDREEIGEDQWTEVHIDGTLVGPELHLIAGRPIGTFNPLIHFRKEFTAEMAASVDQVK